MKTIAIGDVHGKDTWKQIIDWHKDADKIIFLGDYCDPYHYVSNDGLINNLLDIIQFKKDNIDKVVLLIGNHDAHYIWEIMPCSRYNPHIRASLNKIFTDNLSLFTMAHQIDNHLFTHAGVSSDWLKPNLTYLKDNGLKDDCSNIGEIINILNQTDEGRDIVHLVGYLRGGDDQDIGGPTWADIDETRDSYLPNIHQYVGHSKVQWINKIETLNNGGSITYCDTLSKSGFSLKYDVLQIDIN